MIHAANIYDVSLMHINHRDDLKCSRETRAKKELEFALPSPNPKEPDRIGRYDGISKRCSPLLPSGKTANANHLRDGTDTGPSLFPGLYIFAPYSKKNLVLVKSPSQCLIET